MRRVGDGGRDVVFVPADAFVYDRVSEAVLVVIEAGCSGFHFDEDHFIDVLDVHAFGRLNATLAVQLS